MFVAAVAVGAIFAVIYSCLLVYGQNNNEPSQWRLPYLCICLTAVANRAIFAIASAFVDAVVPVVVVWFC